MAKSTREVIRFQPGAWGACIVIVGVPTPETVRLPFGAMVRNG